MYKIIDDRSTGKSSRLMLLAKENNGIIVCANPTALQKKALNYGIVGIDFISYEKYIYTEEYDTSKPIFIDELDGFLKAYDPAIQSYTLTEERGAKWEK